MSGAPEGSETVNVPPTAMGERYLKVHAVADPDKPRSRGDRTAFQRRLAEHDLDQIAELGADFVDSVKSFSTYRPRQEPFRETRKPLGDVWQKMGAPVTNRLAARLESDGIEVTGSLPSVACLERELTPSRTTSPSHFEQSEGTKITLDFLFADGEQPVIAEVKALSDESAYYALIQGLAACAQLAPPAQRERLAAHYPPLGTSGALALWIVLAEHNSRGEDKRAMVGLARDIAAGLLEQESVRRWIAEIRCVEAELPSSGPVKLTPLWP